MAGPKKPETKSTATGLELLVFVLLLTAIIPVVAGFFTFTFNPLEFLLEVRAYFIPFFERYLFWLEVSAVILSAGFLWGIVYIISQTNY